MALQCSAQASSVWILPTHKSTHLRCPHSVRPSSNQGKEAATKTAAWLWSHLQWHQDDLKFWSFLWMLFCYCFEKTLTSCPYQHFWEGKLCHPQRKSTYRCGIMCEATSASVFQVRSFLSLKTSKNPTTWPAWIHWLSALCVTSEALLLCHRAKIWKPVCI